MCKYVLCKLQKYCDNREIQILYDQNDIIGTFLYIFVNHDCNERSPQYFIITIINAIDKGQYKTEQLVI